MSARPLLAAALVALTGCGEVDQREVRLLAPVGIVSNADSARFERETGCRVDLRVYDPDEDLDAIAERRDTDAIAGPTPKGATPHVSHELVRATLRGDIVVTVPRQLAAALDPLTFSPAGRRDLTWTIREAGGGDECARRWIAYATSQ